MSVRNKLIYTLCYFARRFSSDDIVDIYKLGLKLTHQDISEMIGSTRETTSIEFRKLMTEGGVIYNRTQCVINVPRLEEIQNK
ncbi:winged helix-turn-helix domain-containing protein [Candidatus Saccharibacteria bacterium]|nr:winged helix-turn-helix domain-containing protein [Candidatus Saccharibacteria bacterium]